MSAPGWERLDGRAALLPLAVAVGPLAAAAAAVLFTDGVPALQLVITIGAVLATALVVGGIGVLRVATTRYRVTSSRLEVRRGLLLRTAHRVPLARITGVELVANAGQRLAGLTAVRVATAGLRTTTGSGLSLDGIRPERAAALRGALLGGPDRDAADPADAPVAELDRIWIRYAPLTVWGVGGVLAAAGTAYRILHGMRIDPLSIGPVAALVDRFGAVPLWFGILVAAVAVVVLGVVACLAAFVENWSGYRLHRAADGALHLRRGLLATRSVGIAPDSLHGLELCESLPHRMAGAARLEAVAAGLGDRDENRRRRRLTPAVPRAEALRIAAAVDDRPTEVPLHPHPAPAGVRRRRRALLGVWVPASAVAVVGVLLVPWLAVAAAVAAPVLTPVALLLARDAHRSLGHALHDGRLVVRAGTFTRRTSTLDTTAIVGWTGSRSPFQRRSGLVTLAATTAAGDGAYRVRDVGPDRALDLAEQAVPGLLTPFLVSHPAPVRERTPA